MLARPLIWTRRRLALAGLLAFAAPLAQARTVQIVRADSLELNTVDNQEIVVISGDKVELKIDDDVVTASRVEFNRSRRTLMLVGEGSYDAIDAQGKRQHLSGENLVVHLGSQSLSGEDVIVSDANLEIRGEAVERVPGHLNAQNGVFTSCARCGRTPNDYAVQAKRLLLYPGDRLIAYQATVLLAGTPVLYLPIVAVPLNEDDRQPKLSYSNDSVDGRVFKVDLPFAIGTQVLGTTLLRSYQNRPQHYGFGTDMTVYAPAAYIDRINIYALRLPKPLTVSDGKGYDLDYTFGVKGRVPLEQTQDGLRYTFAAVRREIDLYASDPERGVTYVNGSADVTYTGLPRVNTVKVNVTVADRRGPAPTTALSTVLKTPEVSVDPDAWHYTTRRGSTLSADFKVTLGRYMAASNPLNRSVTRQGLNFSTWRLQEEHRLAFYARPWAGADAVAYTNFNGKYYLSGQRVVDLDSGVTLSQTFGLRDPSLPLGTSYNAYGTAITPPTSLGSWSVGLQYLRREGVSPFAFDRIDSKRISAPLKVSLNLTPTSGVQFRASQAYDLLLPADQQQPAEFSVNVSREPLQLNLNVQHDFFRSELESVTASGSYGAQATRGLNFAFSGSYTRLNGPGLLTTSVKAIGGVRTNNVGVSVTTDLKRREIQSVTVTGNAARTRDNVYSPLTLSASETIYLQRAHADGNYTLSWRQFTFNSTHSFTLPSGAAGLKLNNPDTLYFSVGNVAGTLYGSYGYSYGYGTSTASAPWSNWQRPSAASLAWNLKYGGPFDLRASRWTAPTLSLSLTASRPAQRISAQLTAAMPGSQQSAGPYLRAANLGGDWQFNPRVALSGIASYSRQDSQGGVNETLSLQPLALHLAIGPSERPGAYLSATFRQTLSWHNGIRSDNVPFRPIVLLTVDRCCWAFQAEVNPIDRRFRVGIVLPGAGQISAFENTSAGNSFPLFSALSP